MGAWGLGLFQSDYDFDLISELSAEAGLDVMGDETLYRPDNPEKIRTMLNNGVLAQLFVKYAAAAAQPAKASEWWGPPAYRLVLLGALAMQLGCIISSEYKQYLTDNYRKVGLMRDSLVQMSEALASYVDGVPHDFHSKSLIEVYDSGGPPEEDCIFPGMMNVPSPETGMGWANMLRGLAQDLMKKRASGDFDYADNLCGNCGAKEAKDGDGALKKCGGCKKKLYCGVECQKVHWKKHKIICKDNAKKT
ncbi:hypothetical protein M8818_006460 [Zalaria obscura]|uniref:Uncharacterized protein n=1 Tax=Zalaria obscura TaxID=2024903 RepID=A0ACC3S6J0_9PEZI